ncbi:hypothetical protein KC357_g6485 [Hortaea werneckii]|nr:hypothetical protein KC357_g6485 [Hortaea werneckii]
MKVKDPDNSLEPLPEHVESVRKGLLNFACSLPINYKHDFDHEFEEWSKRPKREPDVSACPPETQGEMSVWHFSLRETRRQKNKATSLNEHVDQCKGSASYAKMIAREKESDWAHYYRTNLFIRYHDVVPWTHWKFAQNISAMDELSGESSELFDQWRLVQGAQWYEHSNMKNLSSSHDDNCTAPQPDLTYGFPVYPPADAPLSGFGELECGRPFRADALRTLRLSEQLLSSPGTGLSKPGENLNGLNHLDLLCYPWAIVEFKHGTVGNGGKTKCVDQEYRCIYTTSVELTWGVHACRLMVKHMHIWASRILKPRIWMCLANLILELGPEDRAKISTAAASSGQQENRSNGIPKTPERPKANGVQSRAQTSIGKKSRQSKDFCDTPVRGSKPKIPEPQTAPPGPGKGSSRSMGNGDQRPGRRYKSRPSSGEETDGLVEDFESLDVDEDSTNASPTVRSPSRIGRERRKKSRGY